MCIHLYRSGLAPDERQPYQGSGNFLQVRAQVAWTTVSHDEEQRSRLAAARVSKQGIFRLNYYYNLKKVVFQVCCMLLSPAPPPVPFPRSKALTKPPCTLFSLPRKTQKYAKKQKTNEKLLSYNNTTATCRYICSVRVKRKKGKKRRTGMDKKRRGQRNKAGHNK